ncbi:MAG: class I SAM-dependent methyltransferase [Candidatus Brocadiaceae bacterium]|nr:class I SAM-dependent methyltransferase [Candidatus Brocadiaceae bacterium]
MYSCYICQKNAVQEKLNAGLLPVSNRFLSTCTEGEFLHKMVIGQCGVCGLVQTIDPVPARELLPTYDWITYNEPEEHLDQMVDTILKLPGVDSKSKICGISYKDDSTLARFKKNGIRACWRIDPKSDLGINRPGVGVEGVQGALTVDAAESLVRKKGRFDVLIVRHILEHAYDFHLFMESIKKLVVPDGYIVFEVPDCRAHMEDIDYTIIWEEHILYFTETTFNNGLIQKGFKIVHFESRPYPIGNSLIAIVQVENEYGHALPEANILNEETNRLDDFAKALPEHRSRLNKFLGDYQKNKGRIALFGAGHLACTYIHLMGLGKYIEFVVDDNPKKQGLYMPGSRLPIRDSSALIEEDIKLCLLSPNPLLENKLFENNQKFIDKGGMFLSIYPTSKYFLNN